MDNKYLNLPIEGMQDIFGVKLRKLDFISRKFVDAINQFGYDELVVPLIERAGSFSENIVGMSPWPEWDKRGCFYLKLNNYSDSFEEKPKLIDALLIPEGTIPITRWLGKFLDENPKIALPIKVFYKIPCFRNELLNQLSSNKKRQFTQFGLEILGSKTISADVEIVYLINKLLSSVGIEKEKIRIRISNVGIFNRLINDCSISHEDSILLKESMDTIAECRAGKKPERKEKHLEKFHTILSKYRLSKNSIKMWDLIINHNSGIITSEMYTIFPKKYSNELDELNMLCNELQKNQINSVLDLCVVRSHEYYTGISFEVDVIFSDNKKYIEIAGGGRYDRLIGNFVHKYANKVIPATGFAFGMERVLEMLDEMNLFVSNTSFESSISFDASTADTLLVLNTNGNPVEAYFKAINIIESSSNIRYDIFFGNTSQVNEYCSHRKIKNIQTVD